ncbi:hypothetical protein NOLU111490_12165 [Novosphingobium lubricantis]
MNRARLRSGPLLRLVKAAHVVLGALQAKA